MRKITLRMLAVLLIVVLAATACGGDDASVTAADAPSNDDNSSSEPADEPAPAEEPAPADEAPAEEAEAEAPAANINGPSATLTLANGDTFEFSLLCALAAQENFDFNVASYDDPYHLDISQFSEDSVSPGTALVSVYDSTTFDTLWEANTMYPGGEMVLTLNGSTITGTGTFFPEGDPFGEAVEGDIIAQC